VVAGGAVAVTGLVWGHLNRPRTILPGESGFALRLGPLVSPTAGGLSFEGTF